MGNSREHEDLAQLIQAIRDEYDVNEPEIARRIGVHVSTVNSWTTRRRGGGRGPARETLEAIAREFPSFPKERVFAAAKRRTPGPLSPDAEERVLALYRELTAEQQEAKELEMRALVEHNRSGA